MAPDFLVLLAPHHPTSLRTFLNAASASPGTATHYEFMQDYTVHIKHEPGSGLYERIPYFSLPANGAGLLFFFVFQKKTGEEEMQFSHPSFFP